MIICITGQPLAGKSTFADELGRYLGWSVWSSGTYARELGMMPDEDSILAQDLSLSLNERINSHAIDLLTSCNNQIIEGWPRSIEQVMLLEKFRDDFIIIFVFINPVLQMQRMQGRGRKEDIQDVVVKRSEAALRFHNQLMEFIPERVIPFTADGIQDVKGAIECLENYLVR